MFPLIRKRTFLTDEYVGLLMMDFASQSFRLNVNNATIAVVQPLGFKDCLSDKEVISFNSLNCNPHA